eukprot:GHVO01036140.1.p1 GENE.GHVO01036140.1~~GHVO01036140.1.p1  ORF type:complete len:157 (+),score=13.50 GHVO01036140.1:131-601(+)
MSSMSSLQELHFTSLSSLSHLPNLQLLRLRKFTFESGHAFLYEEDRVNIVANALRAWPDLQYLRIYVSSSKSLAFLNILHDSIASCKRLRYLDLGYLDCFDESILPGFLHMLNSLTQIRKFYFNAHRSPELTEEGFNQLLPLLTRKGIDTDFQHRS